jgi:hypothetical protein
VQDGQRGRGQGRGHVGLVAELAHLEIGRDGEPRQLARARVVVARDGVRDHKLLAVRAERAALGQKLREGGVFLGVVDGPRVHDAEAEALHLLGQQTATVERARFVLVRGKKRRLRQRVDRVGHDREQPAEARLAGFFRIQAHEAAVGLQLRHAHVARRLREGRHALRRGEHKHVAVEDTLRRNGLHGRHGRAPGVDDLVELQLPAGDGLLVHIADADGGDSVPAQKPEAQRHRAAHVAHGDDVDALFLLRRPGAQARPPPRPVEIHGAQPPGVQRLADVRRQRQAVRAEKFRVLLPRRQLVRVRGGEGRAAALFRAPEKPDLRHAAGAVLLKGQLLLARAEDAVNTITVHP